MIASTGHTWWPVFPKYRCVPCRSWSVFDCFNVILTTWREVRLSKATSVKDRWLEELKWLWVGAVNSLTRNKPKKAMQQVAHIIRSSCVQGCLIVHLPIFLKVIGWHVFWRFCDTLCFLNCCHVLVAMYDTKYKCARVHYSLANH